MIANKQTCTITDAAQKMGVSTSTLCKWINSNKLKAEKRGRIYYICVDELERFRETYQGGRYREDYLRQIDSPEDIQICLHCIVPFKCIPSSPECGLRRKGKEDFLDRC